MSKDTFGPGLLVLPFQHEQNWYHHDNADTTIMMTMATTTTTTAAAVTLAFVPLPGQKAWHGPSCSSQWPAFLFAEQHWHPAVKENKTR